MLTITPHVTPTIPPLRRNHYLTNHDTTRILSLCTGVVGSTHTTGVSQGAGESHAPCHPCAAGLAETHTRHHHPPALCQLQVSSNLHLFVYWYAVIVYQHRHAVIVCMSIYIHIHSYLSISIYPVVWLTVGAPL